MLCAFTYVTSHCCTTCSTESRQVHKIHEFNQARAPPKAHRTKPGTNPHTVPSASIFDFRGTIRGDHVTGLQRKLCNSQQWCGWDDHLHARERRFHLLRGCESMMLSETRSARVSSHADTGLLDLNTKFCFWENGTWEAMPSKLPLSTSCLRESCHAKSNRS